MEQKPSDDVMRRVRPLLDLNVWLVAGSIDIRWDELTRSDR